MSSDNDDEETRLTTNPRLVDPETIAKLTMKARRSWEEKWNALTSARDMSVGVDLEAEIAQLQYVSATGNVRELNRYFLWTADREKVIEALKTLMHIEGETIPGFETALTVGPIQALQKSDMLFGQTQYDAATNTWIITNARNERFRIAAESISSLSIIVIKAIFDSLAERHAILQAAATKETIRQNMEKLYATNQSVMMEGLQARIRGVETPQAYLRMQQVYTAFRPYAEGKELPPGTTPEIMRLLVVSAGIPDLWKRLDALDPRLGDVLISCYAEGLSTAKLVGRVPGVNSGGNAGYLVRRGLTKLFEWMPERSDDFPIDKHSAFPLPKLLAAREERMRVAGEERTKTTGNSAWGKMAAERRWLGSDDLSDMRDDEES